MVPSSMVAVTVTSLAKPFMVAVTSSPVASSTGASVASGSSVASSVEAARLFRASTTAVEVMVAPATASTSSPRVTGRVLPMNCAVKSSSPHFWPKPAVSPLASTVSAVMVPSSMVAVTVTSLAKPFMVAVTSSPVASSTGASVASGSSVASSVEAARLFRASTTAVEVMVAPATASTSSPRVTGRVLPMNCAVKSSSPHF